jgi:hypothetical protein
MGGTNNGVGAATERSSGTLTTVSGGVTATTSEVLTRVEGGGGGRSKGNRLWALRGMSMGGSGLNSEVLSQPAPASESRARIRNNVRSIATEAIVRKQFPDTRRNRQG